MASLVRVYCLYTVKHPAGRPRACLDCFTTSRRSEVDRGEKWCISLFPSLSFSLQHVFLKLPILERAGPRELNYLLVVVVVAVEPSSCFLCLIFTHAHTSFNAMISREDGAYLLFESGVGAGNGFRRWVLVHLPHGFEKKRAG